jgi:glycosyltransferase involved in cell wall biosynthesis
MHIAINTAPLSGGHSVRGIGIYTKQLIDALKKFESAHTYSLITNNSQISKDVDIVHYPFFDPFYLTLPMRKKKPTVVTVHDVIPIINAQHFKRGVRGELKWRIQKLSLMGAIGIITDSENSKREIIEVTHISETKIQVVYLAPSEEILKITDRSVLEATRETHDLGKDYILYVGDVNWNKNIPGLLHAFSQVAKLDKKVRLILVGKAFLNTNIPEVKHIDSLISSLGLGSRVRKLGYVSDVDLSGLYSLATCLVMPSFAEGFGLPILEAMKCGCPVVAARGSSLSEIAGPAITVSPEDPWDIARGIIRVLRLSSTNRRRMVSQGIAFARRFTWERVAHETLAVYHKTLRQRNVT